MNTAHPDPRERLIAILSTDFTPESERAIMADPTASDFAKMVAQSRAIETINERVISPEYDELCVKTLGALATSAITEPFQEFIASHVARAFTYERAIEDIISVEQLGLIHGDGIYNPAEAEDIEARSLRGFMAWIIEGHVLTGVDENSPTGKRSIVTNPDIYGQLIDGLDDWTLEYILTYGKDPFENIDPDMFFDTARKIDIVPEGSQWSHIVNRLKELREGNQRG